LSAVLALALVLPPAPTARVNDYAGALQPAERERLEATLAERERVTGVQMVIAVFKSLEGESLEDYSIRLAQQWRIGQKGLDNGLILLVFIQERKVRVEVGYGLEPTITDVVASQIIREQIAPRFREGRYAAGLEAAVAAVFDRIEAKASPEGAKSKGTRAPLVGLVGFLGILGVIAVILFQEAFSSRRFLQRNGYTGGRGGFMPPVIVTPPWRGGWGGRGGDGDGGFSGGGGGGFGGGGASGDW
jgi:uncharacterized protein